MKTNNNNNREVHKMTVQKFIESLDIWSTVVVIDEKLAQTVAIARLNLFDEITSVYKYANRKIQNVVIDDATKTYTISI